MAGESFLIYKIQIKINSQLQYITRPSPVTTLTAAVYFTFGTPAIMSTPTPTPNKYNIMYLHHLRYVTGFYIYI